MERRDIAYIEHKCSFIDPASPGMSAEHHIACFDTPKLIREIWRLRAEVAELIVDNGALWARLEKAKK